MYLFELKSPTIFRKFTESDNQPRIFLKFHEKFRFIFFIILSWEWPLWENRSLSFLKTIAFCSWTNSHDLFQKFWSIMIPLCWKTIPWKRARSVWVYMEVPSPQLTTPLQAAFATPPPPIKFWLYTWPRIVWHIGRHHFPRQRLLVLQLIELYFFCDTSVVCFFLRRRRKSILKFGTSVEELGRHTINAAQNILS